MSNLSFISKIYEKVDLQQLVDYLDHNNLLCTSQSAYRPHYSTETLLRKTANDILLGLDKIHVSLLTLLGLSSAFDTIDHNILLNRLSCLYGISGTCLSWFRSYLSNRRQSVAIANRISSTKELHNDVPQVSVCHTANMTHTVCHIASMTHHMSQPICHTPHATANMTHTVCHISSMTHCMSLPICHTLHVTTHMSHTTCHCLYLRQDKLY